MQPHVPAGVHFIPGHPLAGTEKSGPDAGFADLFENRWCIFTPLPDTDPDALEKLSEFWRRCGANIDTMDPQHHDMTLAIVSHLPHIIAYNIVGTADDLQSVTKSEVIKYSASGFRDFTRLAASDPTMWRDVCLHNKDAILEMLARFSEDLASLQRAIRWGDGEKLFDLFTRTRAVRRSIIEAGQDIDAPGFRPPGGRAPSEGIVVPILDPVIVSRNAEPPYLFVLTQFPKGKRYALFPGKPLHTFPGIAQLGQVAATMASVSARSGAPSRPPKRRHFSAAAALAKRRASSGGIASARPRAKAP